MAKDYIPTADLSLKQWLTNLKKAVTDTGAQWGLDPGEISAAQNLCAEYIAQIDSTAQARIHAKSQVTAKRLMLKTHQPRLRNIINRMKPSMSKANAKGLKVMSQKEVIEESTYKPRLKLKVASGHIEVSFKKQGIAGMLLRVKIGTTPFEGEWTELGLRLRSPLKYKPKGYPPGTVLQVWFCGRAVINDEPIGEWSNISSVLFEVETE